mgnify:CR=1 FL=1
MVTEITSSEEEKKLIQNAYRQLLRCIKSDMDDTDRKNIRMAYELAVEAHAAQRRKSGEPYILHPIAVARICAEEIGLGPTAIVAALLHDVVEDTDVTLHELQDKFGARITKMVDGVLHEPFETLVADVEETHQGGVIQGLAERGGKMVNMVPDGKGRVRLEYAISSRGLIGFRSEFINNTGGSGLLFHNFDHFGPASENKDVGQRYNGVMLSNEQGKAVAYALFNLQERGAMIASHGDEVYEGQIVGVHSRDNDLVVNVLKGKKLTNMRASGSDENVVLTPPRTFSLEQALEFINDDELVELTPENIRLRKKFLKEHERKRADRG